MNEVNEASPAGETGDLERLVRCGKVGKKWARMAAIYLRFAKDYPRADISDDAAIAMCRHESMGEPMPETGRLNGYVLGKKWMDVTVAGWKEEIAQGGLLVSELQEDGYPDWFLKRVGVLNMQPTLKDCAWWMNRRQQRALLERMFASA